MVDLYARIEGVREELNKAREVLIWARWHLECIDEKEYTEFEKQLMQRIIKAL